MAAIPQHIWNKIERITESGCWIWMGGSSDGYGKVWWEGRHVPVHRLFYKLLSDSAFLLSYKSGDLEIDHLCRVRCCCNPEHLELVTRGENIKRGTAYLHVIEKHKNATHCQRGHAWTPENTYVRPNGKRYCRECKRAMCRHWEARHG